MQRRSFVATLFAPLLRRFLPAKPMPVQSVPLMGSGRLTSFGFSKSLSDDHGVSSNLNAKPLSVESLSAALMELQRMKDDSGAPVIVSGPMFIRIRERA